MSVASFVLWMNNYKTKIANWKKWWIFRPWPVIREIKIRTVRIKCTVRINRTVRSGYAMMTKMIFFYHLQRISMCFFLVTSPTLPRVYENGILLSSRIWIEYWILNHTNMHTYETTRIWTFAARIQIQIVWSLQKLYAKYIHFSAEIE